MRLALMTEPQQGLSYDDILAAARTAEEAGLEAFFRSDHYASFPGPEGEPTTDAWATLAGLARDTSRIHLGALVSPVTFRLPGPFAKTVTTVDEMSGGRVEVGMGAGWNDEEHAQHGIPFPPLGQRYEMLEESVEILHGLWSEPDGWSFSGRHWSVEGARFHPKPGELRADGSHPNLILGGAGRPRLARLVARFADEFNLTSASPGGAREANRRIDEACETAGRDPGSVCRSAMTGVLIAETEAELQDRIRVLLEFTGADDGADADAWLAERRSRWILGTLEQAGERLAAFADAGVERVMLQDFLPRDLDMIALMGRLGA
ncbi:MAG TPA: TIGR03560 family F420-dependent LLM class oxidoreductase [Candidatus Limnocylindria bacterium]|jgi:F420-dependent oxidoreductase-like protein|nr:TIGR03560 family F420-dependent LLM class oxidoreductase [Candidatus Limnocylindria bacterium]